MEMKLNDEAEYGRCTCGAALIPIWDAWWEDDKHIRGVSCFRCPECLHDFPAPPDYDTIIEVR